MHSNQVNQHGGYTQKTPKNLLMKFLKLQKILNLKKIYFGRRSSWPFTLENKSNKVAIKNSIELINKFVSLKFAKIHIDTSIKCKNDKKLITILYWAEQNIFSIIQKKKKLRKNF